MITRLTMACVGFVFMVGCSGNVHSKTDVERGKTALVAALDAWKSNEPPAKLKSLAEPIEFADDLRNQQQLVDYKLGEADAKDPQTIRYNVNLKLKDRKGKESSRDVVYMVNMKNPIVIARDPYN